MQFNALITVLETLLVPADYKVRIDDLCVKGEKVKGFMDFQDGLNIFIDVTELNTLDVREDDLRAWQYYNAIRWRTRRWTQAKLSLELLWLNQMHMADMHRMSRQRYKDSTRREALQETN